MEHIDINNIMPQSTLGYIKGKGTTDLHFNLIQDIKANKGQGNQQLMISIDFSRATKEIKILVNFNNHHKDLKNRCTKDVSLLKILNARRDTPVHRLKTSIVKYSTSETNVNTTQGIQNSALRNVLGLARSSPVVSIASLSGVPPRNFINDINISRYVIKKASRAL